MKKITYLCSFFVLILISPTFVNADCTQQGKDRLNGLLNKVEVKKQYLEEAYYNGFIEYNAFSITLLNMNDEIYAYDENSELYYDGKIRDDEDKIIFPVYEPGARNIILVAGDKNCAVKKTITIVIPTFNNYSLYPDCDNVDITKFKYCDPWYQGNIDYDDFFAKYEKYKSSENSNDNDDDSNEINNDFFTNLADFVDHYFWYLIGIGVVAFIVLCASIIIRKRRNKDEFKK